MASAKLNTAANLSVFKKKNSYTAKVLEKCDPGWSSATMLVRCMDADGRDLLMQLSHDCYALGSTLEKGRIYDFHVPGACVKTNTSGRRLGVGGAYEISSRYRSSFTSRLAAEGWVANLAYDITSFDDLGQLGEDAWVDVTGKVTDVEDSQERKIARREHDQVERVLKSRDVTIRSGEKFEVIQFLGSHASISLKTGDVLAVRGCKVHEYRHSRKLATSFVTFVEVNPPENPYLDGKFDESEGGRGSKAMNCAFSNMLPLPVSAALEYADKFLSRIKDGEVDASEKYDMMVVGRCVRYTDAIFQKGAPFFGNADSPKLKVSGGIVDGTATFENVVFWDEAARRLFQTDGAAIQAAWTACEDESKREAFVQILNEPIEEEYRFVGSLESWAPAGKEPILKHLRFHVNQVNKIG